jgi:hypothetical protein
VLGTDADAGGYEACCEVCLFEVAWGVCNAYFHVYILKINFSRTVTCTHFPE